jgi:outer membrane murein-binding lipoprotein Lpp
LFVSFFTLFSPLNAPAQNAAAPAGSVSAAIPSGAVSIFRQVDQNLDKADKMLGEAGAQYDKDYRAKEAAARLKDAKSGMETVERRYGAKMDKAAPDLVSRNARIADLETKVGAFGEQMSTAIKGEAAARDEKNKTEAAAQEAQAAAETARQKKGVAAAAATAAPASAPAGAAILFSKSPIDPNNPTNLTKSFQAGDSIYGLIRVAKPWREIYNAKNKSEVAIMVVMKVGSSETLQYVTLKKPEFIDSNYLVLDIAPEPEKMTAYKNPDIVFGESKGNRKIGPIAFTYDLAQLPAGKHTVNLFVRDYGDKHASGSFEIEGTDFKAYADLHEKVKAATEAADTLPAARMVNKDLEAQMHKLLENAGWSNILRVVIIDKDWWVEADKSRYLNVAAAAKDASGKCYWCKLQFTQPKLIGGGWGDLELTMTGEKRNIAEENVNK